MAVDKSQAPYNDDFNAQKNFKSVMFKAGQAVQARELNQLQSIAHDQRTKHADHIFKNGSRVNGGGVSVIKYEYARLKDLTPLSAINAVQSNVVLKDQFVGLTAVGDTSKVEAIIVDYDEKTNVDPNTLFLKYTKTGIDVETVRFIDGEIVDILDENNNILYQVQVRCPECAGSEDAQDQIKPTGSSKFLAVADGTYYYNGFFIEVQASKIYFSKYGEDASCKIGFDVMETIVTSDEDETLLDNSLGYPNEMAIGADREVMNVNLVRRTDSYLDGTNFIELAVIEQGYVQTLKSDVQYSGIMDTMAQRTYEESGNYTIGLNAFKSRYIENMKKSAEDPNGFSLTGDEAKLTALIGTGIGYVKGYRTETAFEQFMTIDKARTTKKIDTGTVYFGENAFIDLVPVAGMSVWANDPASGGITEMSRVTMYDGAPTNNTPSGNVIGSLVVTDVIWISTNSAGKDVYRYFVTDVKMTGTLAQVKSLSNETNRFLAEPNGQFAVSAGSRDLFFRLPQSNVKSLRDMDDNSKGSMIVTVREKYKATLNSSGSYTFESTGRVFLNSVQNSIIVVGTAGNWTSIKATTSNLTTNGTSLTVSLGSGQAGKNVTVIHDTNLVNLTEKTKRAASAVITLKRNLTNNFNDLMKLGKADVFKFEYIRSYKSSAPSEYANVLDMFTVSDGVTNFQYGESTVKLNTGKTINTDHDTIDVLVHYFEHSDPNNAGYFTVDSYDAVVNDPDVPVTYATLPKVTIDGKKVSVSDIVDFRPLVLDGVAITNNMPSMKSTAIFDLEYYIGRIDYLALSKDGLFTEIMGVPSENPIAPVGVTDDYMPLFEVEIPAYTYSYKDVKMRRIDNRRFTMRDIGRIVDRVENLEYYTTMSLLESQTMNSSVKDKDGIDRFKNGMIVDAFNNYSSADILNPDFKGRVVSKDKQFKPNVFMQNRKFKLNAVSSNFVNRNGVLMTPYNHQLLDEQPFASRAESINPYLIYRQAGTMVLSPNVDTWSDVDKAPEYIMNIDAGVDAMSELAETTNKLITNANDWAFANKTITGSTGLGSQESTSQTRSATSTSRTANSTTTTTTTTTTTNTTRTDKQIDISAKTDTYSFDTLTDVSIIPYMRATQIELACSGLSPNTRFYVFFDNKNVTSQTMQTGSSDAINNVLSSGMIISDKDGNLTATINIKDGQFFTGTKLVRVTNDPSNTGDEANETSYSEAQFFAGGLDLTKQEVTLNVTTPVYNEIDVVTESTSQKSSSTSRTTTLFTPRPTTSTDDRWRFGRDGGGGGGGGRDPLAQSFKFDMACMISKLELFFESVDANTDIWFEIRTMSNGYPTETVLGRKIINTANIQTSFDASVATVVEFPTPVYVSANVEYCFVVGGESPNTKLWIAKLGERAVNAPNKVIDTQVTLGSSFRSQNGSTWNAEQYNDLMYKLYVCKFNTQPMNIVLDAFGGNVMQHLHQTPFESETNSNLIRVYMKNDHGFIVGDKVDLFLYTDIEYSFNLTNGKLVVGHELSFLNGATAKVKTVEYVTATACKVTLDNVKGRVVNGDSFTANPFVKKAESVKALTAINGKTIADFDVKQAAGSVSVGNTVDKLNGISVAELNGTHIVKRVDDNYTFVIEVTDKALASGRFGASRSYAVVNTRIDMMNFSGSRILYDGDEAWVFDAASHGDVNSIHATDNYRKIADENIVLGADRYLNRPLKLASERNENEKYGKKASVSMRGTLRGSTYVSPMLHLDSFSLTTMSNDVFYVSAGSLNAIPNSAGRFVAETHPSQGSEHFKYVSSTVKLNNPATELRVWFDAYKPSNTEIEIYVKLMTKDGDIDGQDWVKVTGIDNTKTSASLTNLIEYDIVLGDVMPDIVNDTSMFSAFKVKLVGKTKNSSNPPLFGNYRSVAYT